MPIAYEGAGTPFTATGLGTSFTLNKPSGATAGMRLYATLACWANGSQKTISATGWTHLNTVYRAVSSNQLQVTVLTRYVQSGDPDSWTASASGNVALRVAGVVAYSGVQETGNRSGGSAGTGATCSTGSASTTTVGTWRLTCGAYYSGSANYDIECSDPTRRWIADAVVGSDAVQAASFDSNGTVSTGSHSRNISRDANWSIGGAVLVLLIPSAGTPASGDWVSTLAPVAADGVGEVHDDATLAAELPGLSVAADGEGQPVEGEGGVTAGLPPVEAAVEAGVEPQGSLAGLLPLTVSMRGETRLKGVRVVNVDADDRVIKVQSRAVTG